MATALKDIPFTTPVMAGVTGSGGGTTYSLGIGDSIDWSDGGAIHTLISYQGCGGWYFFGTADKAGSAEDALAISDGSSSLSYFDISTKLDRIVDGNGGFYFIGGLQDPNNDSTKLSYDEIYSRLSPISTGSGTYFDGALTCNGSLILGLSDGGGTVMHIGGSDYTLSVDSNGFVKATLE